MNLTANAPPIIDTQVIGLFHFILISSHRNAIPQWYMQTEADATSIAMNNACIIIFAVSIPLSP